MLTVTSKEDLAEIDNAQKAIAIRFEKSNEMIQNCNAILANHLNLIGAQLGDHTKTVKSFKVELDNVFARIKIIKNKIREKYPNELEIAESEELEKMPPPLDN